MTYFFSQRTQKNRTHRGQKDSGPSPGPSPEGKGSDHRDTPIMRVYASFYPLIDSLVGVTSHTMPLPAGEGLGEGPLPYGVKRDRFIVNHEYPRGTTSPSTRS